MSKDSDIEREHSANMNTNIKHNEWPHTLPLTNPDKKTKRRSKADKSKKRNSGAVQKGMNIYSIRLLNKAMKL